jgi:hypothetical protein
MATHPRTGACLYDIHLGGGGGILVPGWNSLRRSGVPPGPTTYIEIDAARGTGHFTFDPPSVPADEIHTASEDDLPPLAATAAWRQMRELSTIMARRPPPGVTGEWLAAIEASMGRAAAKPLREDADADHRIATILTRVQASPGPSAANVRRAILEVVEDCLTFRLSLTHAYNVVAVVLHRIVWDADKGDADLAQRQTNHLIGLMTTLSEQRQDYDLGSFGQLTYLALLWGNAALLLARETAAQLADPGLRDRFARWAVYVDEFIVHELDSSLMHPMSWMPFGMHEFMHALRVGVMTERGWYAGAGEPRLGPVQPEEVWPRVEAYSRGKPAADGLLSEGGGQFLCAEILQKLT